MPKTWLAFSLSRKETMKSQISIPVSELKKALPGLSKVISTRSTLPVLGCIRVCADPKDGVSLEGTNLEDYGTYRVHGSNGTGEVLVSFDALNKIVKGCADAESVEIHSTDDQTRIRYPIGSSTGEQSVEHVALTEWPPVPKLNVPTSALDDNFKESLKAALQCASSDESRMIINSVYLDTTEKKAHYMVSTDGRHLFSANSFVFELSQSVVIPTKRFLSWKGFHDDGQWSIGLKSPPLERSGEQGWVQLKSDQWTFITKQPSGNYPNWRQVVPNGTGTMIEFGEQAVAMLLKAIPQMPGAHVQNEPVQLTVHGNDVSLQSRNNETDAWTTVPIVDAKATGKPVAISLNRSYLLKAFKFGLTELLIIDPTTPVVFRRGGKRMVVAALQGTPQGHPTEKDRPRHESRIPESNEEKQPQPTKERTSMSKEAVEAPQGATKEKSAFEQLQEQVDAIKETLKGVVTQLNETLRIVGQAYREKRATEKEIQSIRESLREIQQMKI